MKRIFAIVLLLASCLCVPGNAGAKIWGPPEVVDDSSASDNLDQITASWDAYGNIHVAWSNYELYYDNIFYKRWEYSTKAWQNTQKLTYYIGLPGEYIGAINPHLDSDRGIGGVASHTFLTYESEDQGLIINRDGSSHVFDSRTSFWMGNGGPIAVEEFTGVAHMVYKKQPAPNQAFQLYYSKYTLGSGWSTEIAITSGTNSKPKYDVAVDMDGVVHVVWTEVIQQEPIPRFTLYYRSRHPSDGWGYTRSIAASTIIGDVKIKTDRHPNPPYVHVVWVDYEDGEHSREIFYKAKRGTSWSPDMNLSNDSFVSGFPSMTITPAGDIYVVWSNSEESGIIHCRHWAGSWQPKQTLITGVGDDQAWGPFFITSDWFENLYLFYAGPSGSSKSRLMLRRFADFDLEDKDGDGYTWDVDCDDNDDTIYPGAREICDGKNNDCNGATADGSDEPWYGDPTSCGAGVCATTGEYTCSGGIQVDTCTPGTPTETPETSCSDGMDNDCDGATDEADSDCQVTCIDNDGDGYGDPGEVTCPNGGATDCYDSDNTIYPGAREIRDGKDNDCDGEIDEGVHTEVGTDVKVCDDAEDICITFPEVMEEGNTNVFAEDCQDSPEGFNLTQMDPLCVQIDTDATFEGDAEVCIHYVDTGMTLLQESYLRMIRCDDQGNCTLIPPCDPAYQPDIEKNIVCACTSQFSMFAVGTPLDSDEDSIPDLLDNCPYIENFFQEDDDEDGIGNHCDNCPDVYDPTNQCESLCEGDFNKDGDVDGSDLAVFAADFGRTDCSGDCEGDFDTDGDVDGSDLAVFAADFGRTDCTK